ncbi:MAG: seg [Parcubacteria group bacterium]|nr:seg [Parcubacteria group bacterium]
MRADFFLFLAIFVFVFLLWLYSGGPTHPISFAGPYLTPVTNVGGESQGYGPKVSIPSGKTSGSTFWGNWSAGWGTSDSGSSNTNVSSGTRSPYAGKVYIEASSSHLGTGYVSQEYITLRASTNAGSVGITGWQLASSNSGTRTVILQGTPVVRQGNAGPIILHSGDEALISSASGVEGTAFEETSCTGYLDRGNGNAYYPSLSTYSCPSPINDLGSYQAGSPAQYNQCADVVRTLQGCRIGDTGSQSNLAAWCQNFITNQLTYNGCVRMHQNDTNFYSGVWRVFQGRNAPLWRSSGDTITLYDQNEKVVDQYTY